MHVILVDEDDIQLGIMEKMEAHQKALLHRAFSIFIFNQEGEMLLQRRALEKYHSPGLWTNTCCSHPLPGESVEAAAQRRLKEEMGFETPLTKAFSFLYKASFNNGLSEHEYDHVFIGYYDGPVQPNREEVCEYAYRSLESIHQHLFIQPDDYTVWFKIALPQLEAFLKNRV
jgi:isopentenyl-diphosphate delta-isomerase